MRVHEVTPDFRFCEAYIGEDDLSGYLSSLPPVDLLYASLPKPEFFGFWHRLMSTKPPSYKVFLRGFAEVIHETNAKEYHLEVNSNNKQEILDVFAGVDFSHYYEMPILYSAPLNGRNWGMAKKRKRDEMIVLSKRPVDLPQAVYSHEYLRSVCARPPMVLFDPVIGKGLLSRMAVLYGHACYGIDMNWERLSCAVEFVREHTLTSVT